MNKDEAPSFNPAWEARGLFVLATLTMLFASAGTQTDRAAARLPWAFVALYVLTLVTQRNFLREGPLAWLQLHGIAPPSANTGKCVALGLLSGLALYASLSLMGGTGLPFLRALLTNFGPHHVLFLLITGLTGICGVWPVFLSETWGRASAAILGWVIVSTGTGSLALGIGFGAMVALGSWVYRRFGFANLVLVFLLQILCVAFLALTWSARTAAT